MTKVKPKDKPHYVNNRDFSNSCVEYCKAAIEHESQGKLVPIVSDYIASCFMKIAEGLSHKPNFIRYTYREEMVMDAVENCLKALRNYNIETTTRTGNPNAFAYFTQICYFAFIRRITKEKKQSDIKFKWMSQADPSIFLTGEDDDEETAQFYVEQLRSRIDRIHELDNSVKVFAKDEKKKEKKAKGLELFMGR